jgi:ferredoxin
MPTVTVEGEKSFAVEPDRKLVLAIEDAGIDIMHRCGGNARCTTCRVQIVSGEPGPMGELERERLAREGTLGPDIRLSCQRRRTRPPHRLHLWNFIWRVFFLRGRNGTGHLSDQVRHAPAAGRQREVA